MINLATSILTHPSRKGMLDALLPKLGDGDIGIISDEGDGYWPTAKRAWQSMPDWATHCLLLQDDILPCLDFLLGARLSLETRGDYPVSYFSASKKIRKASNQGYSWAIGQSLSWSQAIALPREMIAPWLAWVEQHVNPDLKSHDARLSAFLLTLKMPVLYSVPCLVEHGAPHDSLIGNNRSHVIARTAGLWFGEEWSALTVNWQAGAEHPFTLPTAGKRSFVNVIRDDSPFSRYFG